jgi:tripartite-type tricarboxylate transporter receptor subunit TctC
MKMKRRFIIIACSLLVLGTLFWGNTLLAQEAYPAKPITAIIPSEAGSGADIMFRQLSPKVSEVLGKPMVIVNKSGAGGSMALRELHDAKPDGYTIGAPSAIIFTSKLQGMLPYDHADYTMIGSSYFSYPVIFASTKTKRPFKSLEEALSFAKSHPREVSVATSGKGYIWWIATMSFQDAAGVEFNVIPQPGTGGLIATQVAGGHTDLGIGTLSSTKAMIDSGHIRLLATGTPKRNPVFKDAPTLNELGYGKSVVASGGFIVGPPKMPKPIVDKLVKAFEVGVNDPAYQSFGKEGGYESPYITGKELISYFDSQREIFRSALGKAGMLKEK